MAGKRSLTSYKRKRKPARAPEPTDTKRKSGKSAGSPCFVIQEHAASSHHFDFRIEVDGVLKSWAVPKGPSTDPRQKRLALKVEDHPMEYAEFEGIIPEGEYGAGGVIIWDAGTYENIQRDDDGREVSVATGLKQGRVEIRLDGTKLKGGYALVRTRMQGQKKNWLIIKMKDEHADARRNPTGTERKSVRSGRTVKELMKE